MKVSSPARALLAPVPKVHLESAADNRLSVVLFGTRRADLFYERGVETGAVVYIYESLDDDRPVGESRVRWQGEFTGYLLRERMTMRDERRRPSSTRDEGAWPIYWEVSALRRLSDDEQFPVSDLMTEAGNRVSPAFIPHGPTPVAA